MERTDLVVQAQTGDLEAYGRLVRDTQAMVYAVALAILRDPGRAEDAAQETFLRAFRSLSRLQEAPAFTTWLRRIAINVAMNLRRSERTTLLRLDDVPEIPVLDEAEAAWSERQRQRLAAALVTLSEEERALSDLRYHGRWSFARLAASRGVSEPVIRKRLQRIRDKLRKEMELMEQKGIETGPDLPAKIVELLARPRLTDLPENPVGQTIARIRGAFADFDEIDLPEVVDLAEAQKTAANAAVYVKPDEIHRLDENRVLRYDLTLPLLQAVRYENQPLRLWAAGKVYRSCSTDATHLEAFHQAELLWVDERERIDSWTMAGRILKSIDQVLPGSEVRIVPTKYPMCSQAWELEVEKDGNCVEVLAWGVFANGIVRHLRADPRRASAIGVGYGLDRLAMLRYDIDDIRKVESASVA